MCIEMVLQHYKTHFKSGSTTLQYRCEKKFSCKLGVFVKLVVNFCRRGEIDLSVSVGNNSKQAAFHLFAHTFYLYGAIRKGSRDKNQSPNNSGSPKRSDYKKSIYSCDQFGHVQARTFIVHARPFCVSERVIAFPYTGTTIRDGLTGPRSHSLFYAPLYTSLRNYHINLLTFAKWNKSVTINSSYFYNKSYIVKSSKNALHIVMYKLDTESVTMRTLIH